MGETIAYILCFVFGVAFFALLQENLVALDTSGWTFTGSAFLISLLPAVPWIFLTGCLAIPVYLIIKKSGG